MKNEQYRDLKRDIRKVETMVMDIYDSVVADKRFCPICKNKVRIYLPGYDMRYGAICPICRSAERHRSLWLYLKTTTLFDSKSVVLHFAPEPFFNNYFSMQENIDYWPVDINPEFSGIRKVVDITDISFDDESVDVILCNHVLEHIVDDKKAMKEMNRVLKKNGIVIITVPYKASMKKTFENEEYNTPELRLKYFGQEDHVRIYGEDLAERLKSANFDVDVIEINKDYSEKELDRYGIKKGQIVFVCHKK